LRVRRTALNEIPNQTMGAVSFLEGAEDGVERMTGVSVATLTQQVSEVSEDPWSRGSA